MLVITRNEGEGFTIGEDINIRVDGYRYQGDTVKFSIFDPAPRTVTLLVDEQLQVTPNVSIRINESTAVGRVRVAIDGPT